MDKVADEDGDLEAEEPEEDEILADLEKEYESKDLTGKHIHSPQLAKLLNKMFRNRLPDKLLKEKLERQARPENCDTAKPTRVNPGIWRKLREPTQKRHLQLFKIKQALVKGIIQIARLTDLSMTEKKGLDQEGVQQIKQFGHDALSLLTHVNYELNMQRKQLMKPCVVELLTAYIERTASLRKSTKQLLICYVAPHGPASKDTISRWIRQTMKDAGINTSVFKFHSTRGAATSAAKAANVPIHEIMHTAGWRSDSIFAKFYDRPITNESNFAEAILTSSNQ